MCRVVPKCLRESRIFRGWVQAGLGGLPSFFVREWLVSNAGGCWRDRAPGALLRFRDQCSACWRLMQGIGKTWWGGAREGRKGAGGAKLPDRARQSGRRSDSPEAALAESVFLLRRAVVNIST